MRRPFLCALALASACGTAPTRMGVTTQVTLVHGPDALNDGGKLYWSCDGAGIGDRSPVTVRVITEDARTGEVLARTDVLLKWDDEKMRVSR